MKWIKAEDLLAARFHLEKDYPKITPPGVDPEVYMRGWNDALEAAADRAEAEPAKRGRWILSHIQRQEDVDASNYLYYCSNCNHADIHSGTIEVPYCWYCGARMVAEEGEPIDGSNENSDHMA